MGYFTIPKVLHRHFLISRSSSMEPITAFPLPPRRKEEKVHVPAPWIALVTFINIQFICVFIPFLLQSGYYVYVFASETHPTFKQRNQVCWASKGLCSCSSSPKLAHRGLASFILALVAISSPSTTNLCLQKQLALIPVMVEARSAWEGHRPVWQVLGGCFSYSTPSL